MRRRTFHFCAMAQQSPGALIYHDGTLVIVGDDAPDIKELRVEIGAVMSPPQERPTILSLTLIHEDEA